MRSLLWLALGLVGFAMSYSTRADQTFSIVRLIGCVLLAIGSFGLLPRYPVDDQIEVPVAASVTAPVAGIAQPIPSQATARAKQAAPQESMT